MSDRAAMAQAFDAAEQAFGPVTILVNNAGVAHSGRAVDMPEDEWRRVLSTNLDAVFFCAQEAARRMLAAGKAGAIVNIASVLGLGVGKGAVAYATAKAGVIQLTKAWRLNSPSRAIRVNAIAPGWIVTDLNREYLDGRSGREAQARNPDRPLRRGARSRRPAIAARVRRRTLRHRRDHRRRRRADRGAARRLRAATLWGSGPVRSFLFSSALWPAASSMD